MPKVSFNRTPEEENLISKISDRAIDECIGLDYLNTKLDITACHANGTPLDLQKLLDADAFNFAHDISGIILHIDRTTGNLTGHFRPRFAK